jgi:phage portal protein BeeE
MLEQELNNKVFKTTEQNNYIKIELKGLLRGDTKARAEYYDKMFKVAAISPNEIRALEDEEPIEGGDNYFVAVNNLMPLKMVEDHFTNEKNKTNGVD